MATEPDLGLYEINSILRRRHQLLDNKVNRFAYEIGAFDALNDALNEHLANDVGMAMHRIRNSLLFSGLISGCAAFAPERYPDDVSFQGIHKTTRR